MITILLPTHRPEQFNNALDSIFVQIKKSKNISQIIINFDSDEIYLNDNQKKILNNIPHKILNIRNQGNLNSIYKGLIESCETEYFYFLEDDDILLTDFDFVKGNRLSYYFGLYKIHPNHDEFTNKELYYQIKNIKNIFKFEPENLPWFQLGQVLFKTKKIKWFPEKEHTYNDFYLIKNNPGSVKIVYQNFFKQGWCKDSYSQNFKF